MKAIVILFAGLLIVGIYTQVQTSITNTTAWAASGIDGFLEGMVLVIPLIILGSIAYIAYKKATGKDRGGE